MKRFAALCLLVPFLLGAPAARGAAPVTELRVANWNVENLYDPWVNQPKNTLTGKPADIDWCASSWRRWTEERYRVKLERLAWALDRLKADVITLEEVENRGVLEELCKTLQKNHGWTYPHIVHVDCSDPRGIDCAILSRYPVVSQTFRPQFRRRGILSADIDVDGAVLTVVVSHWKSQLGDAENNIAVRSGEAQRLRDFILQKLDGNPNAAILAAGDYNENLDGPAIMAGLRPANDRKTALDSLAGPPEEIRPFNLIADIPPRERGSYFYPRRKMWNTFDGLVVSPRMLLPPDQIGPAWRAGRPRDTETFHPKEMRWGSDGRPNAFHRMRSYEAGTDGDVVADSNYYAEGFSDHFPVVTTLRRVPAASVAPPPPAPAGRRKRK